MFYLYIYTIKKKGESTVASQWQRSLNFLQAFNSSNAENDGLSENGQQAILKATCVEAALRATPTGVALGKCLSEWGLVNEVDRLF